MVATESLDHELQRTILLKLIHTPELSFNELWAKEGESNLFAYHVNKLESKNLIAKNQNGKYSLTQEGRTLSAFIEGDTGKKAAFPTFAVIILAKNKNTFLCQKRLKEPFYGMWGFVSGKINFGMNLFECASRDLLEEAGLVAKNWHFRGIEQIKTFEDSKLIHHHYLFWAETSNAEGILKERTHKAENAWLTRDEFFAQKDRFPGTGMFDKVLASEKFILLEAVRESKNGVLVSARITSINEL